ncbi:MAG: type II toxin-antitoxin system VapC family toxin [Rhizobiaceae bacterium]|nr:MAG: type II toxin-antitoxin system VapC family toxin [Rhizobiaceae bacterium]
MFLDASAIVAILTSEEDGDALAQRLDAASERYTSGLAIFETVAALARKRTYSADEARTIVRRFLEMAEVKLHSIGQKESEAALTAFERFGKGRHSASLNMGDCFAYGCAKSLGVPLLFKGDDFPRTDIEPAV